MSIYYTSDKLKSLNRESEGWHNSLYLTRMSLYGRGKVFFFLFNFEFHLFYNIHQLRSHVITILFFVYTFWTNNCELIKYLLLQNNKQQKKMYALPCVHNQPTNNTNFRTIHSSQHADSKWKYLLKSSIHTTGIEIYITCLLIKLWNLPPFQFYNNYLINPPQRWFDS